MDDARTLAGIRTHTTRIRARSPVHRDVAGSIAASLLTQVGLLVSGVAGARILGVLDRGRSALLLLFASVLPLLATLGVPLALTYWIARRPELTRPLLGGLRGLLMGQALVLLAVHGAILVVVFGDAPSEVQVAAAISLLGSPAILAWIYALAILQGTQRFAALNACRLIFPPLNAALLLAMLATGTGGLWLVTTVWVSLYVLSAVVTALVARAAVARAAQPPRGAPGERPAGCELIAFGLKALLGSASPLTQFQLDQTIVGVFISQAALGLYVVAVAFTNLPRFVAQSIGLVAYPHVAAVGEGRGQRVATMRFVLLTLGLCGGIAGLTELVLPFLVGRLFGAQFVGAVAVARILLPSAVLFCLIRVLSDCARGAGRPGLGTIAELVALGSLFPFVFLLSPSGARGVALAVVLAAGAGLVSIGVGLVVGSSTAARRRIAAAAAVPDPLSAVTEP